MSLSVSGKFIYVRHISIITLLGDLENTYCNMSYQSLLSVVALIGTRETDKAIIDDIAFQLQYRVTTVIALLASILISTSEFAGK